VVQAHSLGEVDILDTVLLRVHSGTNLIFIEIGSYLTDKEQKISWHSFLRHSVGGWALCRLAVDMDIHGYIHGYYAGTTL